MELLTIYEISLDIVKTNYVVIKAKQYDKNSRQLVIHCTNNGKQFVLDNSVRAFVQMTKPDGTIFNADCIVDQINNVLKMSLTEQATNVKGVCEAELVMVESSTNQVLSTMIFNIIVIGALITQDDIISQTEFGTLANLIIGYEIAKETVETIEDEMATWISAENERVANENQRIANENSRNAAETLRVAAEEARETAEAERIANENARKEAETTRINSENARKSAEEGRAKFEKARATAESTRVTAENARAAAETDRVELYNIVSTKLANGEFNGRTILYGEGIPPKDLGQIGDVYINTAHTELYPNYLFTKDGEDWTPRWTIRGLDGTDTLPILGTLFYPSDLEIPAGYEEVDGYSVPLKVTLNYDATTESLEIVPEIGAIV